MLFPSPHSGILFLFTDNAYMYIGGIRFPSPHSGILFLYAGLCDDCREFAEVSVPSFGDSFFIHNFLIISTSQLVSVPSFGDSFFIAFYYKINSQREWKGFRPLIRGFFFYKGVTLSVTLTDRKAFPSPHSGILFLFSIKSKNQRWGRFSTVSVPSFGDSFFMRL